MPSAHLHGGAEEALIHLLRYREAAKFTSVLVILLEEGELRKVFEDSGVQVEVIDTGRLREPWKIVSGIFKIQRLLKEHRAELVLGWMTKAHIYGGAAAKLAKIPAIYFQMGLPDNSPIDRLSRKVPAAGALTCSNFAATLQQAVVRHRVIGVALAADFARFSDAAKQAPAEVRRKLGLEPDTRIVGIVGRLQHWKGMHVYVEAMAQVFQAVPNCQGIIVGGQFKFEPEYESWLRERIKTLGLEEKIRMVGGQRNVPEWMQAMDVVVHASKWEPFGIVVIEAMSLGKPVIATEPGGPKEIITDGFDGQLVSWNEPEQLAQAILKYLRDLEWAQSVGERARQRSQEYTMDKYAQRLGEAVRKLLPAARNGLR
jgi:glycosyltransferase involved in cell wall biosynthesis